MIPRACAPTHIRRHNIKTKASVSGRRGEVNDSCPKGAVLCGLEVSHCVLKRDQQVQHGTLRI